MMKQVATADELHDEEEALGGLEGSEHGGEKPGEMRIEKAIRIPNLHPSPSARISRSSMLTSAQSCSRISFLLIALIAQSCPPPFFSARRTYDLIVESLKTLVKKVQ